MIWKNHRVSNVKRQDGFIYHEVSRGLGMSSGEKNMKVSPDEDCSLVVGINPLTECRQQRWWRGTCTPTRSFFSPFDIFPPPGAMY